MKSIYQSKKLWEIVEILDNQRIPISGDEREKKISWKPQGELFPYYGATQQNGWIDDYIFDEELILLWEDGVLFYDKDKPKAYMIKWKSRVNNHAHVLKAKEWVAINSYIHYYLNTFDYHGYVTGATRLKLNQSSMKKIPIPLPDLTTQKAIVAKLDAIQDLIDQKKQVIAKTDELAKSIFVDMFGDPVTNEKGWERHPLKNLTSKIGSGATPRGGKESYKNKGISLIRSMNIYDNKFYYKDLAFIDDVQADKLKNVTVEENDVLFNITGASVCRCTTIPKNILPARVNQHVSIIRPIASRLNFKYLSHLLISDFTKKKLLKIGAGGGAVMEAITKEQLESFEISVPPLSLQQQFADTISQLQQIQDENNEALAKLEELFAAEMQESFSI